MIMILWFVERYLFMSQAPARFSNLLNIRIVSEHAPLAWSNDDLDLNPTCVRAWLLQCDRFDRAKVLAGTFSPRFRRRAAAAVAAAADHGHPPQCSERTNLNRYTVAKLWLSLRRSIRTKLRIIWSPHNAALIQCYLSLLAGRINIYYSFIVNLFCSWRCHY